MKPTLNQLINFCTVAETGNIGKAASQLNISQPPLSRQIAQLETILGAKLFNRAAKGVSLTLAGEQFLLDCRAMLAMLEQACNNVRAIEAGQKGVLKLGATMYASYSVVPHVAMQHRNTCSDVELHFQERVPLIYTPHYKMADWTRQSASPRRPRRGFIHWCSCVSRSLPPFLPTTPRFNTSISGLNHSVMTRSSRFRARARRCSMIPSFISASKLDLVRK